MAEIGFVGLGTMGSAMAGRLVGAGHRVRVWNRSVAATEPLIAAGAVAAESPAHALDSGLVFSMLANDEAADAVFDEAALVGAPGALHVNMASVSPALAVLRDAPSAWPSAIRIAVTAPSASNGCV